MHLLTCLLGLLCCAARAPAITILDRESYYYDGVRRVQEVLRPGDMWQPSTMREYVYGPGYVDELLCQIDEAGNYVYYLQDANYNVVALLDAAGDVAVQYVWSPYGELVTADVMPTPLLPAPPANAAGHQGLFFERLDGATGDPALEPGVFGLFYNRNRWYSPRYGRYTSRDPNETALPILTALAMNGNTLDILFSAMNAVGHYGDGMNLYAYLGGNPVNARDALGLSWEDDEIDDLINDRIGHALYALGTLNEWARWASIGLKTSLNIASAVLGLDVLESVYVLASGQGGFWEAMDIAMTVTPLARLGKVAGAVSKGFGYLRKGKRGARVVGKACAHLYKILPYGQAQKLTANWKNAIQAHHILEVRHAKRWNISTGDVPAVILPKEVHDQISRRLQQVMPYLGDAHPYSRAEVWRAYQDVYRDFPDWLAAIEKYFQ